MALTHTQPVRKGLSKCTINKEGVHLMSAAMAEVLGERNTERFLTAVTGAAGNR